MEGEGPTLINLVKFTWRPTLGSETISDNQKPFKKPVFFHMKSSFRYWDIYFFPNFLFMQKNDLTRKLRLITKFMTSQAGQKMIAIHILPNISRSKINQGMKLGKLMKFSKTNIFLQKSCRKWGSDARSKPVFLCFFF